MQQRPRLCTAAHTAVRVAAVMLVCALSACTTTVEGDPGTRAGDPETADAYQGPPVATTTIDPVDHLEGGAPIYVGSGDHPARCTAGFPLVGLEGIRYYLTAGHCARGEDNAPVFVDIAETTESGTMTTERMQIGRITENQYPPGYVYNAADPTPFPDLALFSAGTKTWEPVPATSSIGGKSVLAGGFPPDRIMGAQEKGQPWCWPVAKQIGYGEPECGQVRWVRENFIGIEPDNPDWVDALGEGYPGTPVWSVDSGSGKRGTVGIMSVTLDTGVVVVNATHRFIDNRYIEDSAIGAKMPEGYVPNPPLFSFPR